MNTQQAVLLGFIGALVLFSIVSIISIRLDRRKQERNAARQERYDRIGDIKDRMLTLQDPTRPDLYQAMRMMRELALELQSLSEKI